MDSSPLPPAALPPAGAPEPEVHASAPAACPDSRPAWSRRDLAVAVAAVVSHRRLLVRGLELLRLAVAEFFLPQYGTLLRRHARPVMRIAHPLDSRIPFVPAYVRAYLGFITLWLEGLGALYLRFGRDSLADIEHSIADLCRLYRTAGRIYKRCQTTTARDPAPPLSLRFFLIRLFDPHLHCVPSLHVVIVCYNYLSLRRRLGEHRGEPGDPVGRAYRGALLVIRSVLLVKQHSLADIGPSLFTLVAQFPLFGEDWVEETVNDLFVRMPGVPPETRLRLRNAVLSDYRGLSGGGGRADPRKSASPDSEEKVLSYILQRGRPAL
jgi:hypothetical protein